jgi:hypothetical protein
MTVYQRYILSEIELDFIHPPGFQPVKIGERGGSRL